MVKKRKASIEGELRVSKVIKIEAQNEVVNEKYKTVFYCESANVPEGRMCIAWGWSNIEVGSEVVLKGRFKDNVFLVWSMNITNPTKREVKRNPYATEIINKLKESKQK